MPEVRGKERFKAQEALRALLDAGHGLLSERGLAPGLDRVTLKDAIARSGVPRTTAYRLFDDAASPLEAFRDALLDDLDLTATADKTEALVSDLVSKQAHLIDRADPVELAGLLRELVREIFAARAEWLCDRPDWALHVSALAAQTTFESGRQAEIVRKTIDENMRRFAPMLESIVGEVFGLRPRPPATWFDLTALVVPVEAGAVLRSATDPADSYFDRPTGPGGELRPWHATSIACEGLILSICEPDPRAAISADLSSWLNVPA